MQSTLDRTRGEVDNRAGDARHAIDPALNRRSNGSRTVNVLASEAMYELCEHTADIALRMTAESLPALFAEAGRALCAVIVENPEAVRAEREFSLHLAPDEPDYLLVDWLTELLRVLELNGVVLSEFDVTLGEAGLNATAKGEPLDPARHRLGHEVKAVTYHALEVAETNEGWTAYVVLDV